MHRIHTMPFFTAAAVTVALGLNATSAFSDAIEEVHKQVSLRSGTAVSVRNVSGKVDISTWDKPFADIRAVKRTSHSPKELRRVSIEVRTDGRLDIETRCDDHNEDRSFFARLFGWNGTSTHVSVDYTIRIPKSAVLSRVNTTSADIIVRDVRGNTVLHTISGSITSDHAQGISDIESTSGSIRVDSGGIRNLRTISGAVRLRDIRGNPRIHTTSGSVSVTNAEGTLDIESTSGSIRVDGGGVRSARTVSGDILLLDVHGNLTLYTSSGDISAEGTNGMVEAHTTSGDLSLSGFSLGSAVSMSGNIRITPLAFAENATVKSISGDIRVRLPQNTNADIRIETTSGDLIPRMPDQLTLTRISRKAVSGRIGTGGKRIFVKTMSGDIVLE